MKSSIIVGGLGRCGTSLVLQMLDAAGVPCVGEWPAYEPPEGTRCPNGHAAKWLEPSRIPSPLVKGQRMIGIWMSRDAREQGASMIKMVRILEPRLTWDLSKVEDLINGIPHDDLRGRRILETWGPVRGFSFDALVGRPDGIASSIAGWLRRGGWDLDPRAMAAAVLPRGPECQEGLDIEATLSIRAEAIAALRAGLIHDLG